MIEVGAVRRQEPDQHPSGLNQVDCGLVVNLGIVEYQNTALSLLGSGQRRVVSVHVRQQVFYSENEKVNGGLAGGRLRDFLVKQPVAAHGNEGTRAHPPGVR